MALKDLIKNVSGVFSRMTTDLTRRPDGGTSHYRPLRKKGTEPQVQESMPAQDPQYVHTGFTGMNPPTFFGGYEQPAAYDQGFSGQPAGETGYFGRPEPARQDSYVGRGSFSGGQTGFTMARHGNNISYMPGVNQAMDRGQAHVEHIMTLTGLKSCYEAIECMKDGETLIVMLDAIANESESMRCQDMLAGAAFTLGCSVRFLQGARIVVIAPEGVKILPEQAGGELPRRAEAPAWVPPAAEAPRPTVREHRRGNNAAEWNAARSGGLEGYNPYTGTMPVAAGSYAGFGGYGI